MSKKLFLSFLGLLLIASMVLSACQTATEVPTSEPTQEPLPSEEPTAEPTEEVPAAPTTTRHGGWLDTVVVVEEPSDDAAIARLEAGDLDIHANGISNGDKFQTVQSMPELGYVRHNGLMNELTFNPAGPVFDTGKLNPFAVAKVREAMNWLVDREYIVEEIMGGLGVPKWVSFNFADSDYARYADVIAPLEQKYAHNPGKAEQVITAEMETLGATKGADGKWMYNDEPVELIFLIRTEDERREIGDYVATLLEDLGFTVTRSYKSSAEAAPIWQNSIPSEGQWHLYTAGWGATVIARDDGTDFGYFYTTLAGGTTLDQYWVSTPEFYELAERLWNNEFTSMEERGEMIAQALPMALENSNRVWLVDRKSFTAFQNNVEVTYDLAAGVSGSSIWGPTLRYKDQEGGSMMMSMPSILTQPWNVIAGSNWLYDMSLIRAVSNQGTMFDPYTGLAWPNRIERAEMTVVEGLPVTSTLDWITLDFAPQIDVPADAWFDWDAASQTFITVGEAHPEGLTANMKSVVYYPEDLYETVRWHDGSNFDIADVVMYIIMRYFDQAKEESPIYDPSAVARYNAFAGTFKGLRIVSEDPLVVEWYDDSYQLDAELGIFTLWPYYRQGESPWHSLTLGIMAEEKSLATFSGAKSTELEVERLSYLAGPTLQILKDQLDEAIANSYIPYAPTLSQYITPEEAVERYQNLRDWYAIQGHFWLGTGGYYVDKAFPVEGTITLRNNPDCVDLADRWSNFGLPKIAVAELEGPAQVKIGDEATVDIFISTEAGEPYLQADLSEVKFIVFNANQEIAFSGVAEFVEEGYYKAVLPASETIQLTAGSTRVLVVVVPFVVNLPAFESIEFVTVE